MAGNRITLKPNTMLAVAAVVAVVGALLLWKEYVGDSLTGGYSAAERRAMARSCEGQADEVTMSFARSVGRIGPENGGDFHPTPNGCFVFLLVPKGPGPDATDPMDAIDEAVRDEGWERRGEASWVRADGFTIRARPEGPDEPMLAEYEVGIWGSAPE
jgi:hypothetical protein